MNYTLIAYTPNAYTRCGSSSSSILEIYQLDNRNDLVENWANEIYQNEINDDIYSRVEFTLLVNGRDRWNFDQDSLPDSIDPFDDIEAEAEILAKQRLEKRKTEKEAARLTQILAKENEKNEKELAEFKRLSEKFGKQK